jgi:hypothetical protein
LIRWEVLGATLRPKAGAAAAAAVSQSTEPVLKVCVFDVLCDHLEQQVRTDAAAAAAAAVLRCDGGVHNSPPPQ